MTMGQPLIEAHVGVGHALRRIQGSRAGAYLLGQRGSPRLVPENGLDLTASRLGIMRLEVESGIAPYLSIGEDIAQHQGAPGQRGLHGGQAKGIVVGGRDKHTGSREMITHLSPRQGTKELHMPGRAGSNRPIRPNRLADRHAEAVWKALREAGEAGQVFRLIPQPAYHNRVDWPHCRKQVWMRANAIRDQANHAVKSIPTAQSLGHQHAWRYHGGGGGQSRPQAMHVSLIHDRDLLTEDGGTPTAQIAV